MPRESKTSKQQRAKHIVAALKVRYPAPKAALDYGSPWELLVATILSAQCTDLRVNKVTPALFALADTAAARVFGTIAIIIAYLTIAGYQFMGGGRLLSILYPSLDPRTGMAIIGLLVVIFTITAGMMSIVSLDVFCLSTRPVRRSGSQGDDGRMVQPAVGIR